MFATSKIQKWGNSSAVRISAKILAAAGINSANDTEVNIKASKGCIVIELPEKTEEELFDRLLSEEPEAKELVAYLKEKLKSTINDVIRTNEETKTLIKKLDAKGG